MIDASGHDSIGGAGRSGVAPGITFLAFAVMVAGPAIAGAQDRPDTGDGFLFHTPTYSFVFRGGYSLASASSDVFTVQKQQLTIGPRGFDALSLGVDFGINVTKRFDLGFTLEGTTRSNASEYRNWTEGPDSLPIRQKTSLSTFALSTNLRYNLRDRGRAISNFAWIPSNCVPYVGVGVGLLNYELGQKGDFVDTSTTNIFTDQLYSQGWTGMGQVFTGFTYSLNARYSLVSEARYTLSTAKLNGDYSDLGRIDLSGLSLNIGTSIRF
jgi:hypothetical protein